MASARFEVVAGTIDGANRTFYTSLPYGPGTTALFLNGQLKRADYDDGWVESDPGIGKIVLEEAPLPGDVVQVFYLDEGYSLLKSEVTPLVGKIVAVEAVSGAVVDLIRYEGKIEGDSPLAGTAVLLDTHTAALGEVTVLKARLIEVC